MKTFFKTDTGLVRSSNQDACDGGSFAGGGAWLVVCDGMGGANGGNVASVLALRSIAELICTKYRTEMDENQVGDLLKRAFACANALIHQQASQDEALHGMGTTAVAVIADAGRLYVAHVGDSRAYIYSAGALTQVTMDHSIVQELVNLGEITEQQAMVHPRRNFITRALGVDETVDTDFGVYPFSKEDVAIVCTDGLTSYLDRDTFRGYIENYRGEELIAQLMKHALQSGGSDNITIASLDDR